MEDILIDLWETKPKETTSWDDVILDIKEPEELEKKEEEPKDEAWEVKWEASDISEELDELDKLLAELDDWAVDDAVAAVEASWEQSPEVTKLLSELKKKDSDMVDLQQALNDLQWRIKSLNQDKYDLTYKNAELEAFGWVTDPSLMIVVRNYEKAKGWDKVAQWKIKRMMSDMYAWIYWEDLDKKELDDKISDITEIETYNSKKNPNVEMKNKDQFDWFSI